MFQFLKNAFSSGVKDRANHGGEEAGATSLRRVLNVGGNSKAIAIPGIYGGWEHVLLDVDPKGNPDIVCDARALAGQPPVAYDSVYCSHNLEHYYRHDVAKVLRGFLHVLKEGGFAFIRVPDMDDLMRTVVQRHLDIDDVLYDSAAGPITVGDVIYGYGVEIESSGNEFYAHKTGFTRKSLTAALRKSGFKYVFTEASDLEVTAIAFKGGPTDYALALLGLSESALLAEEAARHREDLPAENVGYLQEGNELLAKGQRAAAADCYRQALRADPRHAAAHVNLGFVLKEQGLRGPAADHLRSALRIDPNLEDAHYLLGALAEETGDLEAAIGHYTKALELRPGFEWACRDLCRVYFQCGQFANARKTIEAGLALNSANADFHYYAGNLHLHERAPAKAMACYEKALALQPGYVAVLSNMGKALLDMGRLREAAQQYRKVLDLDADELAVDALSCLLFLRCYEADGTSEDYLDEARRYGRMVAEKATPYTAWPACGGLNPPALRIGMVSGDLLNHPVGYFLEDVLSHWRSRDIELVAFPTVAGEDELTARIRPYFGAWHPIAGLSDEAAAKTIHEAGIHILIDLAGHTSHNRLPVFAWKPAPIQVSWLGYSASTGVAEIDYLLADRAVVPESHRRDFTESIWYLPDTRLCFSPPQAPEQIAVSSLPALRNGHLTFGTFQNLAKLNDEVLTAWGQILRVLPDARLRLQCKQMGEAGARESLCARLVVAGIDTERIDIEAPCTRVEYLAAYADVDVILDTFPYPGGTTTCEALWMGVPTLTLAGRTMLARQGAAIMTCAGLEDWVATDEASYIAKAIALATDIPGLAQLRQGLRRQVLATPLFDGPRFAAGFQSALRQIWRAYQRRTEGEGP